MCQQLEIKKCSRNSRVLILGCNSRPIACSAKRAGYAVYAVDGFRDIDLERCTEECLIFRAPPSEVIARKAIEKFQFDAIVTGSGFEFFDPGIQGEKILGNPPHIAKRVSDKEWLAKRLIELGMKAPELFSPDQIKFPAVVKPKIGGGGYLNILAKTPRDLPPEDQLENMLIQEYIHGKHASVSVLSTEKEAIAIAVNEQLLGKKWLNQMNLFGYCGNITPLKTEYEEEMKQIAEKLVLDLGLIGSNGIDFVIARDGVYLIEVNPRFQGSLDTVELATGINVFEAHVKACRGELIKKPEIKQFAAKMIVYASRSARIKSSLDKRGIADIPPVGREIGKAEPVATALGWGKTRGNAVRMARSRVAIIKSSMEQQA